MSPNVEQYLALTERFKAALAQKAPAAEVNAIGDQIGEAFCALSEAERLEVVAFRVSEERIV